MLAAGHFILLLKYLNFIYSDHFSTASPYPSEMSQQCEQCAILLGKLSPWFLVIHTHTLCFDYIVHCEHFRAWIPSSMLLQTTLAEEKEKNLWLF